MLRSQNNPLLFVNHDEQRLQSFSHPVIFLEYLGIGQNKFAQNVGLSAGYVNNLGESISSRSLNKILNVYPQLNEKWLLTGKGEMIKPINTQKAKGNNSINSNINNIEGNVTISHNDFSNLLELQKGYQDVQKELNERLKTSQKLEDRKKIDIAKSILMKTRDFTEKEAYEYIRTLSMNKRCDMGKISDIIILSGDEDA